MDVPTQLDRWPLALNMLIGRFRLKATLLSTRPAKLLIVVSAHLLGTIVMSAISMTMIVRLSSIASTVESANWARSKSRSIATCVIAVFRQRTGAPTRV